MSPYVRQRAYSLTIFDGGLGPLQLGAWGENWHKNHHRDVNAARFGRKRWEIDMGWYVICALKALRLASDVRPTKAERQAYRLSAST